ncbi:MAG: hypothetical protein RRY79_00265 [Clostridia bacterium]
MGGGGGGSGGGGGYSANGNPKIRASRRPLYDYIRNNGLRVKGKEYTLSDHAYNSLFKSQRKDIMPNDVIAALSQPPKPGAAGTLIYINPATDLITGIQLGSFK